MAEKKTGTVIPNGILQRTTPHDESDDSAMEEQGVQDDPSRDESIKLPRVRRKKGAVEKAGKVEGRRLYLSEGVHFRLKMLAYQRGQKLSEVAEDLLDKALPKWEVNRVS